MKYKIIESMERVSPIWVFVAFIVVPFVVYIIYELINDSLDTIWKNIKGLWGCLTIIACIILVVGLFMIIGGMIGNLLFSLATWLVNHIFVILICCVLIIVLAFIINHID